MGLEQLRAKGQNLIEINSDYSGITGGSVGILKTVLREKTNDITTSVTGKFSYLVNFIRDRLSPYSIVMSEMALLLDNPAQRLIDPRGKTEASDYPFYFEDGRIHPGRRMKNVLHALNTEMRFLRRDRDTRLYISIQDGMSTSETDSHHVDDYMNVVREFFEKSQIGRFIIDRSLTEILGMNHEDEETVHGDESIGEIYRRNNNNPNKSYDKAMLKAHMKALKPVVEYLIPETIPGFRYLREYWIQVLSIYDNYSLIRDELRFAPLPVLFDRIVDMSVGNHYWFRDKREQVLTNIYEGDEYSTNMVKIIKERFKGRKITLIPELTDDGTISSVNRGKGQYYTVKIDKWHARDNPDLAKEQKDIQQKRIMKYLEIMERMGANEAFITDIHNIILRPSVIEAAEYGIEISFNS